MTPGRMRVTVQHRILVHLLGYTRVADRFDAPREVTQQGIADVLRVRRSHVTLALQTLRERHLVEDRIARIVGGARRKKAYALTPLGYERAQEARAWIASRDSVGVAPSVELRPLATLVGTAELRTAPALPPA